MSRLNEIVRGGRGIIAHTAVRLVRYFGISGEFSSRARDLRAHWQSL